MSFCRNRIGNVNLMYILRLSKNLRERFRPSTLKFLLSSKESRLNIAQNRDHVRILWCCTPFRPHREINMWFQTEYLIENMTVFLEGTFQTLCRIDNPTGRCGKSLGRYCLNNLIDNLVQGRRLRETWPYLTLIQDTWNVIWQPGVVQVFGRNLSASDFNSRYYELLYRQADSYLMFARSMTHPASIGYTLNYFIINWCSADVCEERGRIRLP